MQKKKQEFKNLKSFNEIIKIYRNLKKIEGIDARFVIENIFNQKLEKLLILNKVDKRALIKAERIINLLKKGERPEYIFKKAIFLEEEFYIEKKVLIPREETSLIINTMKELKKKKFNPERILDFGTGTGILAIWSKRIFKESLVIAVDYLKKAIRASLKNKIKKNLDIKLIRAKNFRIFKDEKFDLIVANPPYLSEIEYIILGPFKGESKSSLLGGKKGYEVFLKWLKEALRVLKKNGIFISEISEFWDISILGDYKKYLIEEKEDEFRKKRVWIFRKF